MDNLKIILINYLSRSLLFDRLDDSSDSDEEIEFNLIKVKARVNRTRPHRIEGYIETVNMYTAIEFQSHFRITLNSFEWLLRRMGPLLKSQRAAGRQTTDPKLQLLSFLWLIGTPDSFR